MTTGGGPSARMTFAVRGLRSKIRRLSSETVHSPSTETIVHRPNLSIVRICRPPSRCTTSFAVNISGDPHGNDHLPAAFFAGPAGLRTGPAVFVHVGVAATLIATNPARF